MNDIFQSGHGGRGFSEKSAACGRLLCDIKISARELLRCRSYDLTELSNQILKQKRVELEFDDIRNMYRYVVLSEQHALQLLMELSVRVMPSYGKSLTQKQNHVVTPHLVQNRSICYSGYTSIVVLRFFLVIFIALSVVWEGS